MEEKERYEFIDFEDRIELIDTENKNALDDADKIKNTLNQQDKRIKELENENQQLKQQLAITEKALELACEHIKEDLKCDDTENEIYNYFKTKAKEMLENE